MHSPLMIHIDIVTQSMERSVEYYSKCLHYKVVEDSIVTGKAPLFLSHNITDKMRLVLLKRNNQSPMMELIQLLDENNESIGEVDPNLRLNISLSFFVSDLNETISAMMQEGQVPVSEIFDISLKEMGKTQIVFFRDPDNYLIEFIANKQHKSALKL